MTKEEDIFVKVYTSLVNKIDVNHIPHPELEGIEHEHYKDYMLNLSKKLCTTTILLTQDLIDCLKEIRRDHNRKGHKMNCSWCDIFFTDDKRIIFSIKEPGVTDTFIKPYFEVASSVFDFMRIVNGSLPITEKWHTSSTKNLLTKKIIKRGVSYYGQDIKTWLFFYEKEILKRGDTGKLFVENLKYLSTGEGI